MSGKVILELNIVVVFSPIFINKHSLEVVSEKVCVGRQIKPEISGVRKKYDTYTMIFQH